MKPWNFSNYLFLQYFTALLTHPATFIWLERNIYLLFMYFTFPLKYLCSKWIYNTHMKFVVLLVGFNNVHTYLSLFKVSMYKIKCVSRVTWTCEHLLSYILHTSPYHKSEGFPSIFHTRNDVSSSCWRKIWTYL